MATKKITDLSAITTPLLTDILPIVSDPAGSATTSKVTMQNLVGGSISIASNFVTASLSAVDITGMTFPIAASEIYAVQVYGTCSKATSADGLKFAINCPTSATIAGIQLGGGATLAAPLVPSLISSINTLGTTLATGVGVQVSFVLSFRVVNSTNAGNIKIQCASVTANSATINAGTYMVFRKCTNV